MNYDVAIIGTQESVSGLPPIVSSLTGLSVAIIDSHGVSAGTTAAGMGHIVVMDDSPAQFALTKFRRNSGHSSALIFQNNVEYESCGTIWVAADESEMAEVHRKHLLYAENGIETEASTPYRLVRPSATSVQGLPEDCSCRVTRSCIRCSAGLSNCEGS